MSSIEERRSARTGAVTVRVKFRHAGRQQSRTFETRKQAQAWQTVLDTMGADAAVRLLEEASTDTATVADLIDHHIRHLTGVDAGTVARYRRIQDQHLREHFSHILAADLTRDDVRRWVAAQDVAPKTLWNWHSLLSAALASAVERGAIPGNVAKGVKLPRRDSEAGEDMVFLTKREAVILLEEIPERWRPLVLFLLGTGVRWGEATALTVGALDRPTHSARIHSAWKQSGKVGAPKSRRSRRTVVVPEEVFAAIAPLLEGKRPDDLVFLSPRGLRVRSGNFYNGVWKQAVDRFEARVGKRPRVHDLRHSYASWAIQDGVPLPVIQRQLGHEHISTTVDTYGHLARSDFDPLLSIGAALTTPDRPALEAPADQSP